MLSIGEKEYFSISLVIGRVVMTCFRQVPLRARVSFEWLLSNIFAYNANLTVILNPAENVNLICINSGRYSVVPQN